MATEGKYGERIQALMNEVYAYWNSDEGKGISREELLKLGRFSDAHKIAVTFGNLNYQVENGGIHQYISNGYFMDSGDMLSDYLYADKDMDDRLVRIFETLCKLEKAANNYDCGGDGYYPEPCPCCGSTHCPNSDGEQGFIGDEIDGDAFDAWYYANCGKEDWWELVCRIIDNYEKGGETKC